MMSASDHDPEVRLQQGVRKRLTQVVVTFLLIAALLFAPAGDIAWSWGWMLLGIYIAGAVVTGARMLRLNPATIAARAEATGQRGWDRAVGGGWAVATLATLIVAGLDWRWAWTPELALPVHLSGMLGFSAGLGLFMWAMVSNAAFATVARVGPEGQHRVCSTGPYRWVRHPGYVGAIIQAFATPFLLGSLWALVPGLIAAIAMIIRTRLEDAMLRAELPGYAAYSDQVRYRLAPGLW